jgi:hypothetical protein
MDYMSKSLTDVALGLVRVDDGNPSSIFLILEDAAEHLEHWGNTCETVSNKKNSLR